MVILLLANFTFHGYIITGLFYLPWLYYYWLVMIWTPVPISRHSWNCVNAMQENLTAHKP